MNNFEKIKKFLFKRERIVLYILLLECVLFSIANENFFTVKNAMIVLRQVSINGILALGITFLIISGNTDLAAGSTMAFAGLITADAISNQKMPILVAVAIGVAVSISINAIIGVIVAKGKIPSFIATLGMNQLIRGVTMLWTNGIPISGLPEAFTNIGTKFFLAIPIPVYIYAASIAFAAFYLKKTPLGRYNYAIGGNQEATRLSGVNVDLCKIKIFALHGLMVGLASVVLTARVQSGQPGIGEGYALDGIAATVIGGTSFAGGVGTVFGAVLGAVIMGVIQNGLDLMIISPFYQQCIKGAIIIVAVLLDRKRKI